MVLQSSGFHHSIIFKLLCLSIPSVKTSRCISHMWVFISKHNRNQFDLQILRDIRITWRACSSTDYQAHSQSIKESVGLRWDPRICISNRFPGDPNAVWGGTHCHHFHCYVNIIQNRNLKQENTME